ncbi:MAG: hypothetical protein COY74_05755 [Nitrosopumilales archaeon CG_4_10_14_0_8_um_filter_34_8]|nr:MAG: hypothetical protein COY74_05755 [Nitrosopumilales archaeon CG_4_10_14_0_8_um_filter_34_8]PJB98831.1 MAG: hypothetical protein CO079_01430 [Nitrosopumilales archaeon CG_4_9_14_0_8_um_filter_34_10]
MNLGRKLLIIGGIIVGLSYMPLLLMMFGYYPTFLMQETWQNSGTHSVVSGELIPFVQIFVYVGFSLLIAGGTYRFWRRK